MYKTLVTRGGCTREVGVLPELTLPDTQAWRAAGSFVVCTNGQAWSGGRRAVRPGRGAASRGLIRRRFGNFCARNRSLRIATPHSKHFCFSIFEVTTE